jgi:hypothetical protein
MKVIAAISVAVAALAVASGASARPTGVMVMMHEPGCHSFFVNGKYMKKLTVRGPAKVFNYDEDAIIVRGNGVRMRDRVGKYVLVRSPGVYKITMVKQEAMDYTLTLTVK